MFFLAQGGTNNSILLEHIEEVRRSQLAVCQTAQLVQEQVAQLVASRTQLEAHRSALHHHLAAITSIIASTTNHSAPTTSAPTSTPSNPPSTISNSTQVSMSGPVSSSMLVSTGTHTLASGNPTTHTATTATSTNIGHSHPMPLTTTSAAMVSGHGVINRSMQSLVPNASGMTWAGLPPPYIGSTNMPLSVDGKDGVIYSHMTTNAGKDAKTIVSSVSTSKPNRISLPHGNNKLPNARHAPGKAQQKHTAMDTSHTSPVKYNGLPPNLPKQIFKPLQISGPNANTNLAKKTSKMTYCPPPSVTGHSQASVALVTPTTTTVASQNGLLPLPVMHSSVGKNGRTGKAPIGFTPYSKTSPTKVTQSWISN